MESGETQRQSASDLEAAKERARELVIDLLLDVKSAYIRAGANPVKHIEQIQDRMRAAARQCSSVEEWWTTISRKLGLGAPSSSASSTVAELAGHARDTLGQGAFLDLIEREHGYLIAEMRVAHEEARADREGGRRPRWEIEGEEEVKP